MGGVTSEAELLEAFKEAIEADGQLSISHRILDPTLAFRTIADRVFSLELSTDADRDWENKGQSDVAVEDLVTVKFAVLLNPEDEFGVQLEAGRTAQRLIQLLCAPRSVAGAYVSLRRVVHAVSTRREWYQTAIQFVVKRRQPLNR